MKVQTAKATQTAIPELEKEEKTLYYLIIGSKPNEIVLNIGEKSYAKIKALEEIKGEFKAEEEMPTMSQETIENQIKNAKQAAKKSN